MNNVNEGIKVKKNIKKISANFWHYVKKIVAQARKWFSYKYKRALMINLDMKY